MIPEKQSGFLFFIFFIFFWGGGGGGGGLPFFFWTKSLFSSCCYSKMFKSFKSTFKLFEVLLDLGVMCLVWGGDMFCVLGFC